MKTPIEMHRHTAPRPQYRSLLTGRQFSYSMDAALMYTYLEPPQQLRHYVHSIYQTESATDGTLSPVPDGCAGLLLRVSGGEMHINSCKYTQQSLPPLVLYGQNTKPFRLVADSPFKIVVFLLYPHVLKTLFGFDAHELTDIWVDGNALPSAARFHLLDRLLSMNPHAGLTEALVRVVEDYLCGVAQASIIRPDDVVFAAVQRIIRTNGRVSIKSLQDTFDISERTFERKFEQNVGISPKFFATICRFQSSLQQFRHHRYSKLSDIANDNDYADQAHFIRTFKEFVGFSPRKFRNILNEKA